MQRSVLVPNRFREKVMSNSRVGVLVFFTGLAVMGLSAAMGKVLQPQLYDLGIAGYQ